MKVFISWSGEPSRSIARVLHGWLESVVQHVDAWMSDEEIESGARWSDAIAKSLDETDFGIVCVTRENQHAPWLIFEAGALAKSVQSARVVPLCLDLAPSDVTGPLAAFQGRSLDMDGMSRLVHDLNAAAERQMSNEQLDRLFVAMWSTLDAAITEAKTSAPASGKPRRSSDDMLREIVTRVRRIERNTDFEQEPEEVEPATPVDEQTVTDLMEALRRSVEEAKAQRILMSEEKPRDDAE